MNQSSDPLDEMKSLLAQSTVRIHDSNNNHLGTGFFISKQHVVTCDHVIGSQHDINLEYYSINSKNFLRFTASLLCKDESSDLALLETTFPLEEFLPPILMAGDHQPSGDLYGYGYSKEFKDGSSFSLRQDGNAREGNNDLIIAMLCNVQPGHSGSPILEARTAKICGILSEKYKSPTGGALIRPMSSIFQAFSSYSLKDLNCKDAGSGRWSSAYSQLKDFKDGSPAIYPGGDSAKRKKIVFHNVVSECAAFTLLLDELNQSEDEFKYNLILHFSFSEEKMEVPTGAVGLRMAGGKLTLKLTNGEFAKISCMDFKEEHYRKQFICGFNEIFGLEDDPVQGCQNDIVNLTWFFSKIEEDFDYMNGNFEIPLGTLTLTENSSLSATFDKTWEKDLYLDNYEFIYNLIEGEGLSSKITSNKKLALLKAYYMTCINPRLKPCLSNVSSKFVDEIL